MPFPDFTLTEEQVEFASMAAANGSILSEDIDSLCVWIRDAKMILKSMYGAQNLALLEMLEASHNLLSQLKSVVHADLDDSSKAVIDGNVEEVQTHIESQIYMLQNELQKSEMVDPFGPEVSDAMTRLFGDGKASITHPEHADAADIALDAIEIEAQQETSGATIAVYQGDPGKFNVVMDFGGGKKALCSMRYNEAKTLAEGILANIPAESGE